MRACYHARRRQSGRLELAEEIAKHPIASRTIVNRLWARLLGRGIVEPLDDMEKLAWHRDLLDWIAEDFVAHGYDLKHTIEVICTSGSPHATTQENGSSSFSTLTAKPCVAMPRETCTPIEAILRSSTHTPV